MPTPPPVILSAAKNLSILPLPLPLPLPLLLLLLLPLLLPLPLPFLLCHPRRGPASAVAFAFASAPSQEFPCVPPRLAYDWSIPTTRVPHPHEVRVGRSGTVLHVEPLHPTRSVILAKPESPYFVLCFCSRCCCCRSCLVILEEDLLLLLPLPLPLPLPLFPPGPFSSPPKLFFAKTLSKFACQAPKPLKSLIPKGR
jgi:hypothetical protein